LLDAVASPDKQSGDVADKTSQMMELVERILSRVSEFRARLQQVQADVSALDSRLTGWVRLGSLSATVLLLWFAASQVSMFAHAWSCFRKPRG
jgi:hypothetical protein